MRISNLFFLNFFIFISFFGGLLTNYGFINLNITIDIKAILLDFFLLIIILFYLIQNRFRIVKYNESHFFFTIFVCSCIFLVSFTASNFLYQLKGLRNEILYIFIFLVPILIKKFDSTKFSNLLIFFSFCTSIFGCAQFLNLVPDFFQCLPTACNSDSLYGYIRANGLVGSFSGYSALLFPGFLLSLLFFFNEKKYKYFFSFLIILIGLIFTASRFTIIGIFLSLILTLYLTKRLKLKYIIIFIIIIILTTFMIFYSDYLTSRFFGDKGSRSAYYHVENRLLILKELSNLFFYGNFALYGKSGAFEDRSFNESGYIGILLDHGILVGSLYIIFLIYSYLIIFFSFKKQLKRKVPISSLSITITFLSYSFIYLFFGNIINGAFFVPNNGYFIFWLLFGISYVEKQNNLFKKNS